MKYREAVAILVSHGFRLDRQRGSRRLYEGVVAGQRRIVLVSGHDNDDMKRGTLAAIVRQSGLPKKLFRH